MKALFYLSVVLFMLSGCGSRGETAEESVSEERPVRQLLHAKIMEKIDYYRKGDNDNLPLEVFFTDSVAYPRIYRSTKAVFVSHFDKKSFFPEKYYKGILMVDSTVVAIFDRNDTGVPFYDTTQLVPVPIDLIVRTRKKLPIFSVIIIREDSLYHHVGSMGEFTPD